MVPKQQVHKLNGLTRAMIKRTAVKQAAVRWPTVNGKAAISSLLGPARPGTHRSVQAAAYEQLRRNTPGRPPQQAPRP